MFGPQKVKQRRNILSENISRIFMGEELEEISRSGYTEIILMPENVDFRCFAFYEAKTSINSQKRSSCETTILG